MTHQQDSPTSNAIKVIGRVAVSILFGGALLTGCADRDGAPGVASVGSGSASPGSAAAGRDRQVELYRECLLRNGVVLLDHPTEEGLPQVDKQQTAVEVLSAAQEKCRALAPSGGDVVRPAPEDIEARQRLAACVRAHGLPEYPDPDPVTGDPRISDELAARLKNDPRLDPALKACEIQGTPSTGRGVVGG